MDMNINSNRKVKVEYMYHMGDVNLRILKNGEVIDNPPLNHYEVQMLGTLGINGKVPRDIVMRILGTPYIDIIEGVLYKFG